MLVAKTLASAVLPKPTFATGVTLVITGGVTLFVGVGSGVGELMLAVLVKLPLTGAVTVTVKLLVWLFVNVPRLHVTNPAFVTPPPLALTNVTPTGNVSVTTTKLAGVGPRFVTEMVYVRLLVAKTVVEAVLPMARLANSVTFTVMVAVDVPPCASATV